MACFRENESDLHFDRLSGMCHLIHHNEILSKSDCRLEWSSVADIVWYKTQSSAKSLSLVEMLRGKSFIYIKKSRGDRLAPCGTLDVTLVRQDSCSLAEVNCVRPFRKCSTHDIRLEGMFSDDSFASRWLWLTGYCPYRVVCHGWIRQAGSDMRTFYESHVGAGKKNWLIRGKSLSLRLLCVRVVWKVYWLKKSGGSLLLESEYRL